MLKLTLAALALSQVSAQSGYTWSAVNGVFSVNTLTVTPGSGFAAGKTVTVSLSGVTTKGIIAGTTKFQVWEAYQGQFTDQGNSPYFVCTNKGCDPTQPVSLALSNPTAVPTGYTLTFSYVLPPAVYNGQFRLVIWGEDQDHYPYDFDATVNYNYTQSEVAPRAATAVAKPLKATQDPYTWVSSPGAFTISALTMTSVSGHWAPGQVGTVTMQGYSTKRIISGTAKYNLFEYGMQDFVSQGDIAYFNCNNKGCDPTSPVALNLANPTAPQSSFTLTVPIAMVSAQASGVFNCVIWGEDQDHYPYDFDATVSYNYTNF